MERSKQENVLGGIIHDPGPDRYGLPLLMWRQLNVATKIASAAEAVARNCDGTDDLVSPFSRLG